MLGNELNRAFSGLQIRLLDGPQPFTGEVSFGQIKPVALAEVAHCIEWCVFQHHNPGAVLHGAALRVRVARVFVQRVAVAQQGALWAVGVGHGVWGGVSAQRWPSRQRRRAGTV